MSKILLIAGLLFSTGLWAAGDIEHSDPVASVIAGVTLLLLLAIVGRYLAKKLNQPGVLGELLIGVLVGNIAYYFGFQLVVVMREGSAIFHVMREMLANVPLAEAVSSSIPNPYYAQQVTHALSQPNGIEVLKIAYVADIFSRYGVIFLLFMVGLETSVNELTRTGKESIKVAILGVVAPILLGLLVAKILLPSGSFKADLFVAATLCATSVGITARVLTEMKKTKTREARTILGAAMIDDILGLVILAIVSGIVLTGEVHFLMVSQILIMASVFFIAALAVGPWLLRRAANFFLFLELWEAKLLIAFLFVMFLAWLATLVNLATIIGAFAAGVILHDGYFKAYPHYHSESQSIRHLVAPLEALMAPLFFTLIGIQVKLETFMDLHVLLLACGLVVAAIIGKLVSGLGAAKQDDRLLVGIGMLPRGEVGLVFASIGRTMGVINDNLFSAIILMVIVTTFMAPPMLKWRFSRMVEEAQ